MQEGREIDRQAWADLVKSLIGTRARGNQTAFAELVGVTPRTITRWLNQDVRVRYGSVQAVAAAMGVSDLELMVQLGYYTEEDRRRAERSTGASGSTREDQDEAIELIETSDAPRVVKEELIKQIRRQQRHDAQERLSLAQTLLELARRVRGAT
nr:helix-turn-helix transcriptional regulator [Micromonospora sp. DSM 115978]